MGKWSFQQELKREEKELNIVRKENLCKFVYDLAKLICGYCDWRCCSIVWKSSESYSMVYCPGRCVWNYSIGFICE